MMDTFRKELIADVQLPLNAPRNNRGSKLKPADARPKAMRLGRVRKRSKAGK